MVAVLDLAGISMTENLDSKKRETSGYKLYRDTMERLVEIAAFKKTTVADLCDEVLSTLADAEYLNMLNAKLEAEKKRKQQMAEAQKEKKSKKT